MAVGDVHDSLPPKRKGDKGWIESTLAKHMGKWVEIRNDDRVTSNHTSGYKAAAWVKQREAEGFVVEFAVRGTGLYGRMRDGRQGQLV
jgi:hypothetical protein